MAKSTCPWFKSWKSSPQELLDVKCRTREQSTGLTVIVHVKYYLRTRDLPDTSLSAGRPHEAEILCEKNRERIDLLLCDVVMHELSGAELSKRRR
jgi:CheY-like chemotaxis protein